MTLFWPQTADLTVLRGRFRADFADRTDMYETHFGLNTRPFRAHPAGSDIFVGPQTAATMSGLKKALSSPDSIVAVTGAVGVGKTAQVRRALDGVGDKQLVISVGRMKLGHDEVLELLLEEMGATLPPGTVQRFTTFRRMLKEQADQGVRVVVLVEDATRIGEGALSELEALTAADAGLSDGANIVLMGEPTLNQSLDTPGLARLKQRLRLRHAIEPFSASELTGYLKHCFRLAGREYDTLFADGTAALLHKLTDGVARMTNSLVESVLAAAAEAKAEQITAELIAQVAKKEYGIDADLGDLLQKLRSGERRIAERRAGDRRAGEASDSDADAAVAKASPPPIEDVPAAAAEPAPAPPSDVAAELPLAPEVPAPNVSKTDAPAPSPVALEADDDEIPELIQDTLPEVAALSPDLAATALGATKSDSTPDAIALQIEPTAADIPTLDSPVPDAPAAIAEPPASSAAAPQEPPVPPVDPELAAALEAAQVPAADTDVPEWERDPTLAELRPDLEALEHAMAVAQGLSPEAEQEQVAAAPADPDEPVPEITLDRELQAKIDEEAEQLKAAEREAEEQANAEEEASGIDDRPTAEILADAQQSKAEADAASASSIESQLDATDAFALDQIAAVAAAEKAAEAAAETVEPELSVLDAPAKPPAPPAPEIEAQAAEPESVPPEETPDPELQKIASGLAAAKTLDDVDDKMAETLFGEEFSMLAAEVAASAPLEPPANEDLGLGLELELDEPVAAQAAVPDGTASSGANGADPMQATPPAPKPAPRPAPDLKGGNPDLASTQQRLATVRALNNAPPPATPAVDHVVMTEEPVGSPPPTGDHPEPIEEQINTSITQTLKALSVHTPPPAADDDGNDDGDDDGEEEERKGGFFSRFRRS